MAHGKNDREGDSCEARRQAPPPLSPLSPLSLRVDSDTLQAEAVFRIIAS